MKDLACRFVAISATNERGITQLKQALRHPFPSPPGRLWKGPAELEEAIKKSTKLAETKGEKNPAASGLMAVVKNNPDAKEFIQKTRFEYIHSAVEVGLQRPNEELLALTDRLDAQTLPPNQRLVYLYNPDDHRLLVDLQVC